MPKPVVRDVTDVGVLSAVAHPLRRRLLDVLQVDGPATASMLAERTDQAVGNISHHVRVLAAAELVEVAPELARDRRERWWRRSATALRWSSDDFADDAAGAAIEQAAESLGLERNVRAVHDWRVAGDDERQWWGNTAWATMTWLRLTPDELDQLGGEIRQVIERWRDRPDGLPDDGAERRPVLAFAYGTPAHP